MASALTGLTRQSHLVYNWRFPPVRSSSKNKALKNLRMILLHRINIRVRLKTSFKPKRLKRKKRSGQAIQEVFRLISKRCRATLKRILSDQLTKTADRQPYSQTRLIIDSLASEMANSKTLRQLMTNAFLCQVIRTKWTNNKFRSLLTKLVE
jgi:hypothetical protein